MERLNGTLSDNGTMTGSLGTVLAKDGFSPTIYVEEIATGHTVFVTDKNGQKFFDINDGKSAYEIALDNGFAGTEKEWVASLPGEDGISPTVEVTEEGEHGNPLRHRITITDATGSKDFFIHDGSPGKDGCDGASAYDLAIADGFDGTMSEWLASLHGKDGVSPCVEILDSGGEYEVIIKCEDETVSFFVKDGIDGKDGTVAFEELTEAQKESLRGEKGDSYVLTDADKREIADMIDGSDATIPQEVMDVIDGAVQRDEFHETLVNLEDLLSERIIVEVGNHAKEKNPHGTKPEDIGAVGRTEFDTAVETISGIIDDVSNQCTDVGLLAEEALAHRDATGNPHGTTYSDVGAAPAGFGLGENAPKAENWNAGYTNMFVKSNTNSPDGNWWYGINCVNAASDAATTQIGFSREAGTSACEVRRTRSTAGTWGQWEYVNPPMLEGVEYRTTERRNGNAVYKKLVDGKVLYRIDGEDTWRSEVEEALAQANIAYVGSVAPTNDMGKDGDIYIVSG